MDDAALDRIDRRLAVTEDYVRQSAEALPKIAEALPKIAEYMRQGHEYMREARMASERQAQAFEDLRVSTSQWNLRQEKMMRELLAAAQETTASLRELRNEGREEAQAQRAALFAMIDQLRGGGPATA